MNEFLDTILKSMDLIGIILGGLFLMWKTTTKLNTTILLLTKSVEQLDATNSKILDDFEKSESVLNNHETRITVLESKVK